MNVFLSKNTLSFKTMADIIWNWLIYLEYMKLTDHTQSMDGDEQYDHLTVPDFKKVTDKRFIDQLKILTPSSLKDLESLEECMDSEGGSPEGMRLELISILKRCDQFDDTNMEIVVSQTNVSKDTAYKALIRCNNDLVDAIIYICNENPEQL